MVLNTRFLAERSYLYFKYNVGGNGIRSKEFYLPILENLEISESQSPNLATYDIIGRPGNVFAYLGSKSRELSLKFKITLPNVYEYLTTYGLGNQFKNGFRYFYNERDAAKRRFARNTDSKDYHAALADKSATAKDQYIIAGKKWESLLDDGKFTSNEAINAENHAFYLEKINRNAVYVDPAAKYGLSLSNMKNKSDIRNREIGAAILKENDVNTRGDSKAMDSVNLTLLWINVIRSSVVGNAQNTAYGPPTVYVNHGTMYNNIPCICKSVSIRIHDPVGYDLFTMTPRQIEVSMTLSENRTGSFKKFEPFKLFESEGIAGWEAVMDYGPMDPYNSTFGEDL